jgi:dethiobiotin synthetase
MSLRFIVAGTDTDVGKTVFAAALTGALSGVYFKPVQAGLEPPTDTDTVRSLTGLCDEHFLPEVYRLRSPLSPHRAAEIDGLTIDPAKLALPDCNRPLIVEPAGGLLVPLTREILTIELIARWNAPVVLCARTSLGTINHSLLSLEALKRRTIPVLGVAFIGDANADTERTIVEMGKAKRLGRLPLLPQLNRGTLAEAFARSFRLEDFA